MGFGSYDESEQGKREYDAEDEDEAEGVSAEEHAHEGSVQYEFEASNDELIDQLREIKDD